MYLRFRFQIDLDPTFKVEKKVGVVMKTQNGMKLKVKLRSHEGQGDE